MEISLTLLTNVIQNDMIKIQQNPKCYKIIVYHRNVRILCHVQLDCPESFQDTDIQKDFIKVIRGISTTSNPISSKIEIRNKVEVFKASKQYRVKLSEMDKRHMDSTTKDDKQKNELEGNSI